MVEKISGESVLNICSNGRQGLHGTNEGEDMTFGHSRRIRITSLTSNLVYGPISPGYKLRVWNTIFFFLSPPPLFSQRVKFQICAPTHHFRYTLSHTALSLSLTRCSLARSLFLSYSLFARALSLSLLFHASSIGAGWKNKISRFLYTDTCIPLIIGKGVSFSVTFFFFLYIFFLYFIFLILHLKWIIKG